MQASQDMATQRQRLVVYLTEDIKRAFEELAERRNRSASNLAETLIMKEVWQAEASGELSTSNTEQQKRD